MCIFHVFFKHLSQRAGVSTDSHYAHLAWATQHRKQGGLGPDLKLPMIADKNMKISRDYGVLIEEDGVALRGLFLIDPKGTLRYASASLCGVSALTPALSRLDKLPSTTCPSAGPSRRPSVLSRRSSSR